MPSTMPTGFGAEPAGGDPRESIDALEVARLKNAIRAYRSGSPLLDLDDNAILCFDRDREMVYFNRSAATLSGGESQRIRLASQVGSELTGVTYILDEPSIGLHQRDNIRLLETLSHLRDIGNTLIVIEHDRETMESADWIVDIGPGAGLLGGEIVAQGTPAAIRRNPRSVTGRYLAGKEDIPCPAQRRRPRRDELATLTIHGARQNNLANITICGCENTNIQRDHVFDPRLHFRRILPRGQLDKTEIDRRLLPGR